MQTDIPQPEKQKRRISRPVPKNKHRKYKPIDLDKVEALAAQGLNKLQICHCLGIAEKTLYNRQRLDAEVTVAFERGRAKGAENASAAIMRMIQKDEFHAAKFFLTHRADWRETKVLETTGKDGGPIEQVLTVRKPDSVIEEMNDILSIAARVKVDDHEEDD